MIAVGIMFAPLQSYNRMPYISGIHLLDTGATDILDLACWQSREKCEPEHRAEVNVVNHKLTGEKFTELLDIMAQLRGENGCPWDKKQSHASLRPFLLEESHELSDALNGGDAAKIREELGDLLHQIVFHCQIAAELGSFTAEDVIHALKDKMVRRHPHVFSTTKVTGSETVLKQWAQIKANEKHDDASK